MVKIKMPNLGQTTNEIKLISWEKSIGDKIKQGDILCTIETDKAVVEVESYASGILKEIKINEGETVKAGTVIAVID